MLHLLYSITLSCFEIVGKKICDLNLQWHWHFYQISLNFDCWILTFFFARMSIQCFSLLIHTKYNNLIKNKLCLSIQLNFVKMKCTCSSSAAAASSSSSSTDYSLSTSSWLMNREYKVHWKFYLLTKSLIHLNVFHSIWYIQWQFV